MIFLGSKTTLLATLTCAVGGGRQLVQLLLDETSHVFPPGGQSRDHVRPSADVIGNPYGLLFDDRLADGVVQNGPTIPEAAVVRGNDDFFLGIQIDICVQIHGYDDTRGEAK